MSDPLLAAALELADALRPVFWLGSSKRPLANCGPCNRAGDDHDAATCGHLVCHGFYAATCDPDRIRAMRAYAPRGLLAMRTGAVSGLVVVDVDPRNGGDETARSLVSRGLLPPTAWVRTGGGGAHLYYRHPGRSVPCSTGKPGRGLGPGVDVRGDGGYVVAPPSIHPDTGQPYCWRTGLAGLAEMPASLITACLPQQVMVSPRLPMKITSGEGISSPDRLLTAHLDAVRRAPEGSRRTTLYGASRGVARMVLAGALTARDGIDALTDVGRLAQQTERDIRTAIMGGFRAEGVTA